MDQKYNDKLCFLNQVDSNTGMLDNVTLQQVVIQPTEKPRSVGQHKATTNKKKSHLKNKKFRSASTQLRKGSTEHNSKRTNLLQQHLFYTNTELKNCRFVGISIPIVT